MARSSLGRLANALFRAARTTSNAHLAESILTGNTKAVTRSVKTRLRYKAKTAVWKILGGR
jgi:uncharacterized membrane protein YoaK (UPF0700 family)